jgi:CSLREA domain-containing protein
MGLKRLKGLGLLLALTALAAPTAASAAATISPDTGSDEFDLAPAGGCSLREAIQTANTDTDFGGCAHTGSFGSLDEVLVRGGTTYLRSQLAPGGDDFANAIGDLDVSDDLSLAEDPAFPGPAIIQGTGTVAGGRVLDLGQFTPGLTVDMTSPGITIRNGNPDPADGGGGGIKSGAAIFTFCCATVADNTAVGGGGILVSGSSSLSNLTISGNSVTGDGGGLFTQVGPHTLNNVTITGNTSDSDVGGFAGDGGGILTSSGTLTVSNTIVAGNTDASPGAEAPDCDPGLTSAGNNLIGNTTGCSYTTATGDITGISPGLGPLASNGGGTQTHGLLPGSPAIDAGNPALPSATPPACATADQRGVARPVGARCDIGAFEGTLPLAGPPTTTTAAAPIANAPASKKCKKKRKGKKRKKCKKKS